MTTTIVVTDCSIYSSLHNGTTVAWSGDDSVVRRDQKLRWRDRRIALVLKDPGRIPYSGGRFKLPIDVNQTNDVYGSKTIFDQARTKRLRVIDDPEGTINAWGDKGVPHAYSKSWTTYRESVFSWNNGGTIYSGCVSNCGFSPIAIASPWTPEHDYKLVAQLREKVAGTDFNLAEFLGAEGRDTVKFLGQTSNRIYRSMLFARKGLVRPAIESLRFSGRVHTRAANKARDALQKDVYRDLLEAVSGRSRGQSWATVPASLWLEWQLAVSPLLGDVVAAAEMLAHLTMIPRKQVYRTSAKAVGLPVLAPNDAVWKDHKRITRKSLVAYFSHEPDPVSLTGFQDPEVVIWNALPLSFVSDYMYNIGGFLQARANVSALPSGVYVTSSKDVSYARGLRKKGAATVEYSGGDEQFESLGSFTRTISTSPLIPSPSFKPLGAFKSWQRTATVVSLAALAGDRVDLSRFLRD